MDAKFVLWELFIVDKELSFKLKKVFYKKTKWFRPYITIRSKPNVCKKYTT